MKLLTSALLAGVLALTAGAASAEDTTKKVGKGAEHSGKTVVHGTTAVGKGGSKVYHEAAKGIHKVIAKNSKSDKTKAKHMEKAAIHHKHTHTKAAQSKDAMGDAKKAANKVGK